MAITRPRGSRVNPERRQKPLHPQHKTVQENTLTDDKTFKDDGFPKKTEPVKTEKVTPTPVPMVPPNNLTANPDQKRTADGSTTTNTGDRIQNVTDVLDKPKTN